ncbi:ribonuclease E [Enhydrobacter aerosaccus]|uniref:Ribonuclease E n=1 Tax=Enhydrobacter aerosaccus TaxID=225324 RepID=A0A1T4LMP0_9HYPH|nr:ribonuclease E/G [Enhydrobacter aerosaccus]SJZ56020.1 ribonuclease E [Enhydrobacter aerosaccus]
MARRMLIDASHPEETRVVVVDGTRLEEFDFETASRKPLKGNIYLAKVIRIEPSLQAAFVEYGGNRHGFLAFSEVHADYYQIPVADRERLIAEQQRLQAEADEEPEPSAGRIDRTDIDDAREERAEAIAAAERLESAHLEGDDVRAVAEVAPSEAPAPDTVAEAAPAEGLPAGIEAPGESVPVEVVPHAQPAAMAAEQRIDGPALEADPTPDAPATDASVTEAPATEALETTGEGAAAEGDTVGVPVDPAEAPQPDVTVETLGGDDAVGEERETRERRRRQPVRQYKIQEVIKRRQILLVQVVKEERGNKGAALTTYLSLAGRYCVLMPNAGRGGGISRKISNPSDRKRMKEMLAQLEVPQGMGVILRTAGLERSNIDIKRDYEYLSRLWDSIRELTMRSTAPALIYEEGDLVKRSLRDVYDTDIAQVLVEGEAGYQAASEFMRQLMPHEAGKVQLYDEPIPLFHRYQVENQFDAMHSPVVQLRSGGYIVINPTEALVAIDVNSGRSTKERNIEETALRTNIEAAEEVARQVRLRDLAGLIVIDFIDMEETRHQRQVEHKVKEAMRNDRARIQIGRISAFGLLEMSRQRLRPSLLEHSTEICPHCAGTGRVRSIESAALHALRAIEEEGVRRRSSEIIVSVPPNVALYLLNQKRHTLSEIEKRYGFHVTVEADEEMHAADCEIERVRSRRGEEPRPMHETARASYDIEGQGAETELPEGEAAEAAEGDRVGGDEEGDGRGRRRRRRRRRGRRDEQGEGEEARPYAEGETARADGTPSEEGPQAEGDDLPEGEEPGARATEEHAEEGDRQEADRRRRRGRRGGRRRRRENGEGEFGDQAGDHTGERAAPDQGGWEPSSEDQPTAPATPINGSAVDQMEGAHMPVERPPYEPQPAMTTDNLVPPPPPIAAPAEPIVAAAPQPVPAQTEAAEPPPPPPPAIVIPTISTDTPPEKPKRGWWRR